MSQNADAVANQGEFAGHVKPSEPLMTGGVCHVFHYSCKNIENSFHDSVECILNYFASSMAVQVCALPGHKLTISQHQIGKLVSEADRAPEFHAQTLPAGSAPAKDTYTPNPDINNQKTFTSASSTLVGADSGSVHTGLGHPGSGQSSQSLRDNSVQSGGSGGLAGLKENHGQGNVADLKDDPTHAKQRNLGRDEAGTRGNVGGLAAQEKEPESAAQVNTGR